MNTLLEQVLLETGIDFYFLERPSNVFPCIVYTYNEYLNTMGDYKEESTRYDVYLNLFVKENIFETIEKIKGVMENHYFRKTIINAPVKFDNTNYYQVTFSYAKTISK